jgi:hypothetical protein
MSNMCEWFLRCTREATVLVRHPVLGLVPTCETCVAILGLQRDVEAPVAPTASASA